MGNMWFRNFLNLSNFSFRFCSKNGKYISKCFSWKRIRISFCIFFSLLHNGEIRRSIRLEWGSHIVSISIILEIELIWTQYRYVCVRSMVFVSECAPVCSLCERIKQRAMHRMRVNERKSIADAVQTEHDPVKREQRQSRAFTFNSKFKVLRRNFFLIIKSWVFFNILFVLWLETWIGLFFKE